MENENISYCVFMPSLPDSQQRHFRLSSLSSRILLLRCLMDGLNSFDKTDKEYSLASNDDLTWSSEVKVTPWFKYVMVKASTLMVGS